MTKTPEHTPRPYERLGLTVVKTLPPEAIVAGRPRKLCLAICKDGDGVLSLKKVRANANLFATAPETAAERDRLRETLDGLLTATTALLRYTDPNSTLPTEVACRAAVAKAKKELGP